MPNHAARLAALASLLATTLPVFAQDSTPAKEPPAETKAEPFSPVRDVARGSDILLDMQEEVDDGEGRCEWPYEGVYRTNEGGQRRVIPIGYRVGGTAICCLALIEAPGYAADDARRAAVERGVKFILGALKRPLMQPSTENTYDVRGWGHIYALALFLRMIDAGVVPKDVADEVDAAIPNLVNTLQIEAIPELGGWNYAGRTAGSPFMTAPALQALFHAAARGHEVSKTVVGQALDALERARAKSGSIAYSIPREDRSGVSEDQLRFMDKLPGSIGRMAAVESTLWLAGRGDQAHLRAAVEAFFTYWNELEKRRKQNGTHIRPFGVAPYYFIYAHYYVAQAIELIDDAELRGKQRERFLAIMAKVREPNGGWNDRVFPRSRNYGTAMGMMAVMMKDLPRPIASPAAPAEKDTEQPPEQDH